MATNVNCITLPPIAILAEAAATLIDRAAGDASTERAINKALWNLDSGIEIRSTYGGFLMPSGTRAGVIHRVSTVRGCNCEAAMKGHICWHASALAIIEEAQLHTMPSLVTMPEGDTLNTDGMRVRVTDKIAAYRKAVAEMDELFA